jgi:hypothetical protein
MGVPGVAGLKDEVPLGDLVQQLLQKR